MHRMFGQWKPALRLDVPLVRVSLGFGSKGPGARWFEVFGSRKFSDSAEAGAELQNCSILTKACGMIASEGANDMPVCFASGR